MDYTSVSLGVFLLAYYGIVDAHVVDIHVPTASEIYEDQKREEQKEIDSARDTFEDEDASDVEREEAFLTLVEKEEIV